MLGRVEGGRGGQEQEHSVRAVAPCTGDRGQKVKEHTEKKRKERQQTKGTGHIQPPG